MSARLRHYVTSSLCHPTLPPARKSRAKARGKTASPSTPFHNMVAKTRVLRGKIGAVIAHFRAIAGAKPGQTGAFFTPNGPFHTPKPPWRSPNAGATPQKTPPKSAHPPKKVFGIFPPSPFHRRPAGYGGRVGLWRTSWCTGGARPSIDVLFESAEPKGKACIGGRGDLG